MKINYTDKLNPWNEDKHEQVVCLSGSNRQYDLSYFGKAIPFDIAEAYHYKYCTDGTEQYYDDEVYREARKDYYPIARLLLHDHSGLRWWVEDFNEGEILEQRGWDTSNVGIFFVDKEAFKEKFGVKWTGSKAQKAAMRKHAEELCAHVDNESYWEDEYYEDTEEEEHDNA